MHGSPLPFLPIGEFVRAGVFRPVDGADGQYAPEWIVRFAGISGMAAFDAYSEVLDCELHVDSAAGSYRFVIETRFWARGQRKYWMCPDCGKACSDLILIDEGLCRECFRRTSLPYPSRHREALLYEAERLIKQHKFLLKRVVTDRPSKAAAKPSFANSMVAPDPVASDVVSAHDLATNTAIDRGRGMAGYDLYRYYEALGYDDIIKLPDAEGYNRPNRIEIVEEAPRLDINTVYQRLWRGKGGVQGIILQWSSDALGLKTGLFVDLRFDNPIIVLAHTPYELAQPSWQRLTIERHSTGRFRWRCPVLGERVDTLYGRDGLFASRKAQRLVHRSQRIGREKLTEQSDRSH